MDIHIAECLLSDKSPIMSKLRTIFMLLAGILVSSMLEAEDIVEPCAQYYMTVALHGDNTLTYSLVKSQVSEEPYVDSVRITDTGEDSAIVYITSHAQPREKIDISILPHGRYLCYVHVGDCVTNRMFYARPSGEVTENLVPRVDEPFSISPNPARDIIVIDGIGNSCTCIIYDAMGKMSKVGTLDYPYHIDVAQFLRGTYILKVITDDNYSFVKFLKQ